MHDRRFDFAAAATTIHPLAWVALLAGAVLLVLAAQDYTAQADAQDSLVRQVEKLQRRAKFSVPGGKAAVGTAAAGNSSEKSALAARRDATPFPWDVVLREVELATDRSTAFTSLDTDVAQRHTRIAAEARGIDDALAFASRLRAIPLADKVFLLSHEARKDPTGPVVAFTLQIDWSID